MVGRWPGLKIDVDRISIIQRISKLFLRTEVHRPMPLNPQFRRPSCHHVADRLK